ncbi:MAG: IreB family regulatory phosphoprotein [Candidatus Improbicoccus devescovinae]|nr:MAG: IreB family regulatory phosphoprotein [Candidatus Improbicoccus devescovinae]
MAQEQTVVASLDSRKDIMISRTLSCVYNSLKTRGYDAVNQITGYLISEDPTYITAFEGARNKITRLERNEIVKSLVRRFVREDIKK